MLLEPPTAIKPSFGPGSYMRHLAQALARRLDVEVLHLPGLARDIDCPRDLERLIDPARPLAHFQFLLQHVMKAAPGETFPAGAEGRCRPPRFNRRWRLRAPVVGWRRSRPGCWLRPPTSPSSRPARKPWHWPGMAGALPFRRRCSSRSRSCAATFATIAPLP